MNYDAAKALVYVFEGVSWPRKILVVQSKTHWTLPGGKIESYDDNNPYETLIREVDEELHGNLIMLSKEPVTMYKKKGWNNAVFVGVTSIFDKFEPSAEILQTKVLPVSEAAKLVPYWAKIMKKFDGRQAVKIVMRETDMLTAAVKAARWASPEFAMKSANRLLAARQGNHSSDKTIKWFVRQYNRKSKKK